VNEKLWLDRANPRGMLEHVLAEGRPRKLRLLAVALWECRAAWLPNGGPLRAACRLAAEYADAPGVAAAARLDHSYLVSHRDARQIAAETVRTFLDPSLGFPRDGVAWYLHELFGNPFRPVEVKPDWLTSTVVALANGVYDERAFDRLPILADALQDAGCDSDSVLSHCREVKGWEVPPGARLFSELPGPHARGCWVVDLLLGKG
jgi:hypothetical protein